MKKKIIEVKHNRTHQTLSEYSSKNSYGWVDKYKFGAITKRTTRNQSIVLKVRGYQGKTYVELRIHKRNLDGKLMPDYKKGFNLDIDTFMHLSSMINDFNNSISVVKGGDITNIHDFMLWASVDKYSRDEIEKEKAESMEKEFEEIAQSHGYVKKDGGK